MGEQSHTVLLVDDEPSILSSLKRTLHGEAYAILSASSAAEALEVLQATPVDLIISDIGMPGMNGLELLKIVKERYPTVGRIILTAQNEAHTLMQAINEGEVYRFFTKPWDNEVVRISVRHTLKHFDFLRAAYKMMQRLKEQDRLIYDLENRYPGITKDAAEDVYVLSDEYFTESTEDLLNEYFADTIGLAPGSAHSDINPPKPPSPVR